VSIKSESAAKIDQPALAQVQIADFTGGRRRAKQILQIVPNPKRWQKQKMIDSAR
jgi:hypothetical protein